MKYKSNKLIIINKFLSGTYKIYQEKNVTQIDSKMKIENLTYISDFLYY